MGIISVVVHDRDGDSWDSKKLQSGAAWRGIDSRCGRFGDVEEEEQKSADDVDGDHGEIGADEWDDEGVAGGFDHLRPDLRRDEPAAIT